MLWIDKNDIPQKNILYVTVIFTRLMPNTMQYIRSLLFSVICLSICCTAIRADDAWFVDTRHATVRSNGNTIDHLDIKQLQITGNRAQWIQSNKEAFLQTYDPNVPLVIIIHGNLMTYPDAMNHGAKFRQLSRKMGRHRLVVWSWPSERTDNPIRQDCLLKAQRADVQARFLATALRHLPHGSKVSLVGFSFGSRLVCQTLQTLATTAHNGYTGHHLRIRTVLLGAAVDQGCLRPGQRYGYALNMVESMLIHINPQDNILRWYPLLVGVHGPKALGREGAFLNGISPYNLQKIRTRNVQRLIGHDHGFMVSLLGLIANRGDFQHACLFF